MCDSETAVASASLSNDLYNNIKKWKVEKQELHKQLEEYRKDRCNLQAKVEQETVKYEYENNINIQAQDTFKMNQINTEDLCKDAKICLISVDDCNNKLEEIKDSVIGERKSYQDWQDNWEERMRELADKFQSASDLYNCETITKELQNLRCETEQLVKNKQWLDNELLDTEKLRDEKAMEAAVLKTEIQFLSTQEAKHAHDGLDQASREYEQLTALFERLHKQTKKNDSEFSNVENEHRK